MHDGTIHLNMLLGALDENPCITCSDIARKQTISAVVQ